MGLVYNGHPSDLPYVSAAIYGYRYTEVELYEYRATGHYMQVTVLQRLPLSRLSTNYVHTYMTIK